MNTLPLIVVFINEEVKKELEEEEYIKCHFTVVEIRDDEVAIYASIDSPCNALN